MENSSDKGGCPKCGSLAILGTFETADLYEKRGSKLVRKRGVEFLDMDWVCETCGHKWSVRESVKGVRFRSMPKESCPICASNRSERSVGKWCPKCNTLHGAKCRKCGSKDVDCVVTERSLRLVVLKLTCRRCGHVYFARGQLKEWVD